jgi:hypothetical protein
VLVLGLAIGAIAAVLLTSDDATSTRVDASPIELPESVGDFVWFPDAVEANGVDAEQIETQTGRTERKEESARTWASEAFGDAGADARQYASEDLDQLPLAIVVRGPSPGLQPQSFSAAEDLGLEVPQSEIQRTGEVECLVVNPTTPEGGEVDIDRIVAVLCQRSDDDLTVRLTPSDMQAGDAARLVDDLWLELTGG